METESATSKSGHPREAAAARSELSDDEALNATFPEKNEDKKEDPVAKNHRSFTVVINDDGNVSINFADTFKVYEFYGALCTVVLDMLNKPILNAIGQLNNGAKEAEAIKKQLAQTLKALGG